MTNRSHHTCLRTPPSRNSLVLLSRSSLGFQLAQKRSNWILIASSVSQVWRSPWCSSKLRSWPGKMVWWTMCLLYQPENLSLDLQHPCANWCVALCTCSPSAGRHSQQDPWGSLVSQSSTVISGLWVSERPGLKNKVGSDWGRHLPLVSNLPSLGTPMHAYLQAFVHTHVHTQIAKSKSKLAQGWGWNLSLGLVFSSSCVLLLMCTRVYSVSARA